MTYQEKHKKLLELKQSYYEAKRKLIDFAEGNDLELEIYEHYENEVWKSSDDWSDSGCTF